MLFMVKKTITVLVVAIVLLVMLVSAFRFILNGGEDAWIKNEKGIWIKHGHPVETPNEVIAQKQIINCSYILYQEEVARKTKFDSQCLGICEEYAVDIVNVPKLPKDNLSENQCPSFMDYGTMNFVELDERGKVVRVVD